MGILSTLFYRSSSMCATFGSIKFLKVVLARVAFASEHKTKNQKKKKKTAGTNEVMHMIVAKGLTSPSA